MTIERMTLNLGLTGAKRLVSMHGHHGDEIVYSETIWAPTPLDVHVLNDLNVTFKTRGDAIYPDRKVRPFRTPLGHKWIVTARDEVWDELKLDDDFYTMATYDARFNRSVYELAPTLVNESFEPIATFKGIFQDHLFYGTNWIPKS